MVRKVSQGRPQLKRAEGINGRKRKQLRRGKSSSSSGLRPVQHCARVGSRDPRHAEPAAGADGGLELRGSNEGLFSRPRLSGSGFGKCEAIKTR